MDPSPRIVWRPKFPSAPGPQPVLPAPSAPMRRKSPCTSLVIDVDEEEALLRAVDRTNGVPMPSSVAQSPSGKAHVAREPQVCQSSMVVSSGICPAAIRCAVFS
ncbi:hypothetical protein SAMN04487914_12347 [Arthrobacter sp. ok909]|nr:hypothetical protein SAMN04487914_12347 [Arthrobacter sp. ok909]